MRHDATFVALIFVRNSGGRYDITSGGMRGVGVACWVHHLLSKSHNENHEFSGTEKETSEFSEQCKLLLYNI
jgi:hypothetical protein